MSVSALYSIVRFCRDAEALQLVPTLELDPVFSSDGVDTPASGLYLFVSGIYDDLLRLLDYCDELNIGSDLVDMCSDGYVLIKIV